MKKILDENTIAFFKKCKLLVLDFDGVLTNNKVYLDENGKETVRCDRGDGLGLEVLRKKRDIKVVIISKEANKVVSARAKKLKLDCYQEVDPKVDFFKSYVEKSGVTLEETCFVGNDVNDIDCLKIAGLSVGVKDSYPEVLEMVDYVTERKGGDGAVRELCDLLISLQ